MSETVIWKMMDSAPKDGSPVLLGFCSNSALNKGYSHEGYFSSDPSLSYRNQTGWFFVDDDILTARPVFPDCWAELPVPPTAEEWYS